MQRHLPLVSRYGWSGPEKSTRSMHVLTKHLTDRSCAYCRHANDVVGCTSARPEYLRSRSHYMQLLVRSYENLTTCLHPIESSSYGVCFSHGSYIVCGFAAQLLGFGGGPLPAHNIASLMLQNTCTIPLANHPNRKLVP
jgi:hypothetical protein